jgi:hypothetical protein
MKSLTELNTFSAQSLAYDDQGTGAQTLADRYQINGLLDTARPVMENIEKICSAAGSWLSYDIHEGKWGVVINTTGTAVASFDDTNILGSISVSGTGINELYNSVKVEFPHRDLRDSADFVTIEIPDGDRNANEEDNTLNLTYDIINEPIQAQLLGLIELKQSRIDLAIAFQTDFSSINVKAGDLISVTNARFAFNAKLFRVITSSEIQDDDGAIRIEITALEYDPDVYSTADLFRFTRTDENGIITIGSIGTPGTPQVTKIEVDARPRIIIETTAPTGVVEAIEFWITDDVLLQESNRSYKLIAVEKPVGGGVFTSGQQIVASYDSITTGDFIVKTRGVNDTTSGPFSTPSGIIDFNATQLTDAIGPNTQSVDATGQILTLLAVNTLMKQVDDLFKGATTSTGMFSKIFDIFKEVTGIDLVGQASSGTLVVSGSANIEIQDEGISLTTTTSLMNFIGDGVTVTNVGPSVDITFSNAVPGGNVNRNLSISEVWPKVVPTYGGTIVLLNLNNNVGVTSVKVGDKEAEFALGNPFSGSVADPSYGLRIKTPSAEEEGPAIITVTFSDGRTLSTSPSQFSYRKTYLLIDSFFPEANSTSATTNGSYFIKTRTNTVFDFTSTNFYDSNFSNVTKPLLGPLTIGEGTATLYTSAGELIESLSASQLIINNEVIEFPFSQRHPGTDYYLMIDEAIVKYCDKYYFRNTVQPYKFKTVPVSTTTSYSVNSTANYSTTATAANRSTVALPNFGSSFSQDRPIFLQFVSEINSKTGSGNVYIKKASDDSTVVTIPSSTGEITSSTTQVTNQFPVTINNKLDFGVLGDYGLTTDGQSYYITADAGIVNFKLSDGCYSLNIGTNLAYTSKNTFTMADFSPADPFDFVSFSVTPNTSQTIVSSQIVLTFNVPPSFGEEDSTISLYKADGTLVQEIKGDTSFERDKTLDLLSISGFNLTINPTKNFEPSTTYYVLMSSNSVKDIRGITDPWPGISNVNTIRFTTASTIS